MLAFFDVSCIFLTLECTWWVRVWFHVFWEFMTRSTLIHDAHEPYIASGQDAERRRRDVTCIIFTFAPQFVTGASRLLPTKTLPELLLLCGIYCGRVSNYCHYSVDFLSPRRLFREPCAWITWDSSLIRTKYFSSFIFHYFLWSALFRITILLLIVKLAAYFFVSWAKCIPSTYYSWYSFLIS